MKLLHLQCSVALLFVFIVGATCQHGSPPGKHHRSRARRFTSQTLVSENKTDVDSAVKRDGSARFTFFADGLGACGKTNQPTDFIVALNSAQWDGGSHCFEMITITYGGKTTQAQITDECPGCPYNGLDFSSGLFDFFAAAALGVIYGDWSFNSATSAPPAPPTTAPPPPPPPTTWAPPPAPTTHAPPPPPPPPPSPSTTEEASQFVAPSTQVAPPPGPTIGSTTSSVVQQATLAATTTHATSSITISSSTLAATTTTLLSTPTSYSNPWASEVALPSVEAVGNLPPGDALQVIETLNTLFVGFGGFILRITEGNA